MIRFLGNALLFGFVIIGGMVAWSSFNSEDAAADEISIDASSVAQANRPAVQKAATILFSHCDRLVKHKGDIDSITASTMHTGEDSGWRGLPWRYVVEIKVVMSQDPQTLPTWTRAYGHHLHYAMGGSGQPGISMIKQEAHALCSDDPRESAFIRDERLSFIDNLHG